ncbi:MAG TPA: RHS repeat domain-containing protein, partial [Candidatus Deferrimicrobium sp.]|nr:RHS repeat domain-containing protein [Candidatus Deferrimicrobium sp.]
MACFFSGIGFVRNFFTPSEGKTSFRKLRIEKIDQSRVPPRVFLLGLVFIAQSSFAAVPGSTFHTNPLYLGGGVYVVAWSADTPPYSVVSQDGNLPSAILTKHETWMDDYCKRSTTEWNIRYGAAYYEYRTYLGPMRCSAFGTQGITCSADVSVYRTYPGTTPYTYITQCGGSNMTWWTSPPPTQADLQKEKSLACSATDRGNPCNPANGNKFQTEVDSRSADGSLAFTRHYNSQFKQDLGLGYGWTSRFSKRLEIFGTLVQRRDGYGRGEPFSCDAATCSGDSDSALTLSKDTSGFTLTLADGAIERYDLTGRLLTETDRAAKTTSYSYVDGRLAIVTNSFGHSLSFRYDSNGHLSALTDSAGAVYGFSYDTNNNLNKVTFPSGQFKMYHYENTA